MAQIILDISANTHKNNWQYLKRMLDELKAIDTEKHEIIIKHQLFTSASKNIPLKHDIFIKAYNYAKKLGYKTTSSVFDKESLDFLLRFDIPFVKIANNRKLDWIIGEIPRKIPVYVSYSKISPYNKSFQIKNIVPLYCISNYPAKMSDYLDIIDGNKPNAISDHTIDLTLWQMYQPNIVEWHYKLEYSTGLDAGLFAKTPQQLKIIL